jgi:hypothetical protein
MIRFLLRGLREDEGDRRVRSCRHRRTLVIQMARSCSPLFAPTIRRWSARSGSSERRGSRRGAPLRRPVAMMEQRPRRSWRRSGLEDFRHSGHISILRESDGGCGASTTENSMVLYGISYR